MQKFKILKIVSKKGKLDWFSVWIKNDSGSFGYANGYVITHKNLNIKEALKNPILKCKLSKEIYLNLPAKDLPNVKKWGFLPEMMQAHNANINDFQVVGFDTTKESSYKGHYRKHNVESALRHFSKTLISLDAPRQILQSKIENVEIALNELKQTLKKYSL